MNPTERLSAPGASLAIYRDGPSLDRRKTVVLGQFTCETAAAGAQLIREAMAYARAEGFGAVLGPMDGSTWAHHRLVVESNGRPPFFMEPASPEHYVDAFDQAGLKIVSRYVSAVRSADPLSSSSTPPAGLTLRGFDVARAEEELTRIHSLSLQAFASNQFYQPIALDSFLSSYRPVLKAIDPDLVLMVEDESHALKAFLFALPDLAEGAQPTTVILKTYASLIKGGGSMLANAFHERAKERGFNEVIHALMHENNLSASHSSGKGGTVFRRYALWGGLL